VIGGERVRQPGRSYTAQQRRRSAAPAAAIWTTPPGRPPQLLAEFPSIDDMARSNDYMFADKRVSETLAGNGPMSARFHDLMLSDAFAAILSRVAGRSLFVDPSFHGGGFHQGGDGSYLDTHVDFNIHPHHQDWRRVLNVLLYLNQDCGSPASAGACWSAGIRRRSPGRCRRCSTAAW
jgi:hypothetical protein